MPIQRDAHHGVRRSVRRGCREDCGPRTCVVYATGAELRFSDRRGSFFGSNVELEAHLWCFGNLSIVYFVSPQAPGPVLNV